MPRQSGSRNAATTAAVCLLMAWAQLWSAGYAMTTPEEVASAVHVRDSLNNRSSYWASATSDWTLPTDPGSSDGPNDICSNTWSGNWEHLHCRGFSGPYGEGSVGEKDGLITTAHITDVSLDGPVPRQFCYMRHLREFDLDGDQLTGPFPRWFLEPFVHSNATDGTAPANATTEQCLRYVQELDLSYNKLTGTIPPEISLKRNLQEFKVESNFLTGTLPATFAEIPQLWRLRVARNKMTGTIPQSFSQITNLNEIWLNDNDFEGDLSALSTRKLIWATVHNNPRLCGMVPASVRFAHGYNPAGTRLGQPC